jgi:hypothetical protein
MSTVLPDLFSKVLITPVVMLKYLLKSGHIECVSSDVGVLSVIASGKFWILSTSFTHLENLR